MDAKLPIATGLPGLRPAPRLRDTGISKARHKNGEIEVVPVVIYPVDLQHDCKFLYQLNPLPEWGKCWRDFEKEGDWLRRALSDRERRQAGDRESAPQMSCALA